MTRPRDLSVGARRPRQGRTAQAVIDWLANRDQAWRDAVQYVAIDMCTIFKSAIRRVLPQATLVVDHFHPVQLANPTLTEVRRRVTVNHRGRRGRKGNREWELRNRLTRSAARMRGEHVDALPDELSNLPRAIGAPITVAWNANEDLLDLLVTTVETWWPEILAFLHTGITNAGSEGTNRVIKTIARDAYGFRNPLQPARTHPLRDHPSSPRTPRCPLISLSPHPEIVLAIGTELSVPQVSAWL